MDQIYVVKYCILKTRSSIRMSYQAHVWLPFFFLFFFLIFLDLLVSVYIHVIKIITGNLADVWRIFVSSDPPSIFVCEGTGIGYKSIVKLKFCA